MKQAVSRALLAACFMLDSCLEIFEKQNDLEEQKNKEYLGLV
jgi:hypothetical protein